GGIGHSACGSRGQRLLEVPILGHGDLDRLCHDVCPIGAAAEVLRVVVDRSDELDRKTEGHGRELDRRLRLNATSGHWPPSSKLCASAGRFEEGQGVCRDAGEPDRRGGRGSTRDYGRGLAAGRWRLSQYWATIYLTQRAIRPILWDMERKAAFPKTLLEAIRYFSDLDVAMAALVSLRWPAGVRCPHCQS